jgi:hypothetical protein
MNTGVHTTNRCKSLLRVLYLSYYSRREVQKSNYVDRLPYPKLAISILDPPYPSK